MKSLVTRTYIAQSSPGFVSVILELSDGRSIFVNINPETIDVGVQPDAEHYPRFFATGKIPKDGFSPY